MLPNTYVIFASEVVYENEQRICCILLGQRPPLNGASNAIGIATQLIRKNLTGT